jgi:Sugar-transfer associated ATP-grasp
MFKAFNRWLGLGEGGLIEGEILGINMRNALIQKYNPRLAIERARDKVAAKRALEAAGIACTGTVAVLEDNQQVAEFKPSRDMPDAWAIKPARGSQGDGILLAVRREGNTWFKGSGAALPEDMVMHHIQKVVDGGFSGDSAAEDAALIEPLIIADPALSRIVPEGLPDLRVISLHYTPLMAMVRLPTIESDGKANLHQRGGQGHADHPPSRHRRAADRVRDTGLEAGAGAGVEVRACGGPRLLRGGYCARRE